MIQTIPIFQSTFFDLASPEDLSDEAPIGKDLAEYLRERMAEMGISVSQPIQGEGFWVLDVQLEKSDFSLWVQWVAVGRRSETQDWWSVLPQKRNGLLKGLIRVKEQPTKLLPIRDVLHEILDKNPKVSNLRWLNEHEYLQVYQFGAPLK